MSEEKERIKLTGKGFDKSEFEPQERAEFRELRYKLQEEFLTVEAFLAETGLTWLSKIGKGFPAFIKPFSVLSILAGAYIGARTAGWL